MSLWLRDEIGNTSSDRRGLDDETGVGILSGSGIAHIHEQRSVVAAAKYIIGIVRDNIVISDICIFVSS